MKFPEDFRICFPEKNIYISRDHNWAFAVWTLQKRANELNPNATLVHVDAHLDDVWDGLEVEGLHDMKKPEDVFNVTSKMSIDNFIWPAIGTDTIDNVIYISQQTYGDGPFDFRDWDYSNKGLKPVKDIYDSGKHNGIRYWNLEEFLMNKDNKEVKALLEGKDLVLDLDLDYFNENDNDLTISNLMEEPKIIENLTTLRDLYPWKLITVALSPIYSGGDDNAEYLLGLFCKVFNLTHDEAEWW